MPERVMLALRTSVVRRLVAALFAFAAVVFARASGAAPPPPDAGWSCAATEARLAQAESLVQSCEAARRNAEGDAASCAANLQEETAQHGRAEGETRSCEARRQTLCHEADTFVRDLLRGHVTNVGTCVLSEQQSQLMALLRSWENVSNELARIDAFAAGESDALPIGTGDSVPERLVERLLGARNEPLFFRRLITEALKILAPKAWTHMKDGVALEGWFAGTEPLSPDIVAEAQHEHSLAGGGTSLSVAVRLVQSYLFLARCAEAPASRTCGRAHQLAQLLDSTGPLLLRRRIEGVWATDCADVAPAAVLSWIQDFPTTQLSASAADFRDVDDAASAKLWTCYLRDAHGDASFSAWRAPRLPKPTTLNDRTLPRVDALRSAVPEASREDVCGRAVRALQTWPSVTSCVAPPADLLQPVERWAKAPVGNDGSFALQVCDRYARLLWEGRAASLVGTSPHPPTVEEVVSLDPAQLESPVALLRRACDDRRGVGDRFAHGLQGLARIAGELGESLHESPWRADSAGAPLEAPRFATALTMRSWLAHLFEGASACQALGLADARCQECAAAPLATYFDCDELAVLEAAWTRRRRTALIGFGAAVVLFVTLRWAARMRRARRHFGKWARETRDRFAALDLAAVPDPLRFLLPERAGVLTLQLPRVPAWERWGSRAGVIKALGAATIREGDVHHAVQVATRVDARVVFLLHEDSAALDFGAARAILDWAARGGNRTTHVLPLAVSRLSWARNADDLLDLVEESSLRGNPFEVRGRITSSSQFWNRERLVSGLLAEARAGHWLVITGLRRFGKSSLAMEVARRLTGPSAYVDLAGFHHEVGFAEGPSQAVDAILRAVCARLVESALALYPSASVPEPPATSLDAAAFSAWMRRLSSACISAAGGRPPPILIVLDEIEQVLAVGPARLGHVLDVLSILFGRLRNAIGEAPHPDAGSPIGVLLASALHPLLWAPLRTLGQQSIMGAFPSICVPCLPAEAASSMMRGLGARQGIRFSEEALALVIRESQGVPLLLRRIGTSILELYDADRARQGALGAVQVGIEAAREALAREERKGSPLRVWVESEIADPAGAGGSLLRRLAREGKVETAVLRAMAEAMVREQFASSGIGAHLPEQEVGRRAEEAATVIVRLLGESGLLTSHGDLTDPEAYELPDGAVRRILAG
jgi:hypothetical protein